MQPTAPYRAFNDYLWAAWVAMHHPAITNRNAKVLRLTAHLQEQHIARSYITRRIKQPRQPCP
jgi:hypothetical protein